MSGLTSLGRNASTRPAPRDAASPRSPLWRSDWVLWAAVLSLCVLGVLLVAAATEPLHKAHPHAFAEKDVLNLVIGVGVAYVVSRLNYRAVQNFAPAVYVASILGLAATFVIGSTINGSRSWISLGGGFEVQPSEFAKIAVIVLLATLLSQKRDNTQRVRDVDVVKALAIAGVPMLLTVIEPDMGNALVLIAIVFGVLAVGAVPTRWMALLLTGLIAGGFGC